jgi:DMSO/TMAO reductase YedYZ molybdopterin-dependent catalytic subunit
MIKREIRQSLPVHPVLGDSEIPRLLRIDGRISQVIELSVMDLARFPQTTLIQTFTCAEGWSVPDLCWEGVAFDEITGRVRVDAAARWLQASAGRFSVPLPIEAVNQALLATHLDGHRLPPEHGGPVRLVIPGQACFTSVKWLDHLEFRREPGPNTARAIAVGRISAAQRSSTT